MNDVEVSHTHLEAVGVNGCSGVYLWADMLYGLHAVPGSYQKDVAKLKKRVGDKASKITHVAISSPDKEESDELKPLLTWTGKTPLLFPYPYKNDGKDLFRLSASFETKGNIEIANEPLSKSPSPGSSSLSHSSGHSSEE